MDFRPHIERFAKRFAEVEAALSDPKAFENKQRAQELSREYARLKELIGYGNAYLKVISDLAENSALIQSEPNGSDLAVMAEEESQRLEREERRLGLEVQRGILPPDPADSRNTIFEIRAGAGGSESACSERIFTGCTRDTRRHGAGRWRRLIRAHPTWAG
jgi:peptide chain release factor 1